MMRLFVSGTDTGAGKTVLCGLLARHFLGQGRSVRYLKPVQTGHPPDDDAAEVRRISGLPPERARLLFAAAEPVAPCFCFDPFPFDEAVAAVRSEPACDVLLVEGAGGLLAPLDHGRRMHDLARALDLPVVLAAQSRVGGLNHLLLSLHFLETSGLKLAAVGLNEHCSASPHQAAQNRDYLRRVLPGLPLFTFDATGLTGEPPLR
jgi:dethiobiotin synthetase